MDKKIDIGDSVKLIITGFGDVIYKVKEIEEIIYLSTITKNGNEHVIKVKRDKLIKV